MTNTNTATQAQIAYIRQQISGVKLQADHAVNQAAQFDRALLPETRKMKAVVMRLRLPAGLAQTDASAIISALTPKGAFILNFTAYVTEDRAPMPQYAVAYHLLKRALKPEIALTELETTCLLWAAWSQVQGKIEDRPKLTGDAAEKAAFRSLIEKGLIDAYYMPTNTGVETAIGIAVKGAK